MYLLIYLCSEVIIALNISADKCLNKLVNIPLNEFEEVCEYTLVHVHTPY